MKPFNYHTHTTFCDGSDAPEKYVEEALRCGLVALGFSAHGPVPFKTHWNIRERRLGEYCRAVRELQQRYADRIKIRLGLELDFIPGVTVDFASLKERLDLDYVIGSVHFVKPDNADDLWFIDGPEQGYKRHMETIYANNAERAVTEYYRQIALMAETQRPDLIGHLDKVKMHNRGRFFSEEADWYRRLVRETLDAVARAGSIMEVNTRGIYKKRSSLFPDVWILEECRRRDIPVTISADAHKPEELGLEFDETVQILKDIGYGQIQVLHGKAWEGVEL